MRKSLWVSLILLFVVPGLLLTVSCAKKTVKSADMMTQQMQDEEDIKAREAEESRRKAEAEEAARRAAEEERLAREKAEREKVLMEQKLMEQAERREAMAARQMFENDDIYFEFDSPALLSAAQDVLKRKAEWMRDNPNVTVIVEGHCDERGTNEYNLALGERRAESAKMFLVDLGIPANRIRTISYGEERPVDLGHNEEAWAKNRRAHFVIE